MEGIKEDHPENPVEKFSIDISAIKSVKIEDQALELQSLGLSVYDQSIYEKSVIDQVGKAISADTNLSVEENALFRKEEGELDDDYKLEEPNESVIKVSTHNTTKVDSPADSITNIELYLKKQLKLQETKKLQGSNFKNMTVSSIFKKNKLSSQMKVKQDSMKKNDDSSVKKEEKFKYVGPSLKKKRKKEKLGTRKGKVKRDTKPADQCGEVNYFNDISTYSESYQPERESRQGRRTRRLSEASQLEASGELSRTLGNSSGSEYIPSDSDTSSDLYKAPKKTSRTPSSTKKKRRKEYLFFERPDTDDSDWDINDDLPKNKGNKEWDDGDVDFYCKRLKEYDKTRINVGVHKLEGGLVVPADIWGKLYDYQKKTLEWLWGLNKMMTGGILGDEMGLGKTVQVIAFLAALHSSSLVDNITRFEGLGPTLIVCPATVMHQWVREFHKWYAPIRVIILHDSGSYKGKDRRRLINLVQRDSAHGVIITSYAGLTQFKDDITSKKWHYVILDEGHKIRNSKAKVSEIAKMLDTPHRLILSGSPLQNNLHELWCLFDFVCPGKLGTAQVFTETFAVPIMQGGYANASQTQVVTAHKCAVILKDTISPFLLRRMKEDVGSHINLPEKKEQVLFCRLTEEQRQLYKEYIEKIDVEEMVRGRAKIFVALINMRKICNHPDLYSGGPNRSFRITAGDEPPNNEHFGYWRRAGKMIVIESLLKIWNQQGHRVLLFTQSKKMLLILEDFVSRKKYKYLKLDGQTSVATRQPLIDKFNKDSSYFLMLLTTKVGGLGVNLTGANRVVIYDPDWNPATDTQARERAWRIGQERDVTIYRLITAGTIEEKIYHRQIFKQFLSNKILKDPKQRRFFKSNDLLELFTLSETVRHGTTETAAIFAGTGSEIKVPKKVEAKKSDIEPKMEISFSQEKIEQMKKLAQMLSKKFSESNKPLENRPLSEDVSEQKNETQSDPKTSKSNDPPLYGPDGEINSDLARTIISSKSVDQDTSLPTMETALGEGCTSSHKDDINTSVISKGNQRKKRKKSKEKFSTFEGHEISHLVKKRKYKKHDETEQREYLSQDDYVLKKLFSKGIETAMRHDVIMGGGPSDYAIVEAEADRVAQSALKALRESQEQVVPVFAPLLKRNKKDGNDLLEQIKKRNMKVEASTNEQTLLSSIISWLQSQGGTATTNLLIEEFKYKVGEGKTPLFKALLEKIAVFYRGPDKIGYWTIRDEYNSLLSSSRATHS